MKTKIRIDTRDNALGDLLTSSLLPIGCIVWGIIAFVRHSDAVLPFELAGLFFLVLILFWPVRSGSTYRNEQDRREGAKTFFIFRIIKTRKED